MLILGLSIQRVPDGGPDPPLRIFLKRKLITNIVIVSFCSLLANAVHHSELLVVIPFWCGFPPRCAEGELRGAWLSAWFD